MYQKVILLGYLGGEPEMKMTPTAKEICHVSMATNNTYTNSAGAKVKETTWWRLSIWGKTAENVVKYLHKGSGVYVEGRLTPDKDGNPRIWNRTDGSPAASFEVNVDRIVFLPGKNDVGSSPESGSEEVEETQSDNIPF